MLRSTLKSLLARKLRLVLSGIAVVLGVMSVSGSFVLTDTLSRSFDALFSDVYSTTDVGVLAKPKVSVATVDGVEVPGTIPAATLEAVRSVPGVATATGRVAADGARVIGANGKVLASVGTPRLGINWTGEDDLVKLNAGRGPTADGEVAVNAAVAKAAELKVGDKVGVLTLSPKQQFTVVGVFGYSGDRDSLGGVQEVAFTEPVAQKLMLGRSGLYSEIRVAAADGTTPAQLRDRVASAVGGDYTVLTGEQLGEEAAGDLQTGLAFFNSILLGFAAVALFVGIFLILNTFSIIVAQRTRELALMRALGANRRQLIGSVLLEALVIGFVAAVVGLALGVGVGAALASAFSAFSGGLELAGVGVPPSAVISALVVGVLVTMIAAVLPALRASRIPPVAAMQDVANPDRPLTRITIVGAVVTALGIILLGAGLVAATGDSVLPTIMGGVLVTFIGIAMLTPLISRPVVSVLGRIFAWSLPGRLGRLNAGRNPRRTAITAAALMVGIALVTGITVTIESTKSSLAGKAEDTVRAQLVISGDQNPSWPPSFDASVLDRAATLPGVRGAAGLSYDLAEVNGERRPVNAATDLTRLADVYGAVPAAGTLTTLNADQAVMSAQEAADRGVSVGQTVSVQLSRGPVHQYTLVGTYEQDTLPATYVLPAVASADFGNPQPIYGFIRLTDGVSVGQVLPQVQALLADSPEVSAADRSVFIEQQTSGFDQIIMMIQLLLALAILIAVLGVVNTLALSTLERTRELGLLRAVGLSRAQTMRMVTVEAVIISVFGALLGVVVGALLGTAVVQALDGEGVTELVLPWGQMITYLLVAGLVGVVAAILPAIRTARLNVLGAITHD